MTSKNLKFSLDSFRQLDLSDLLINIWLYSFHSHQDSSICKQHKKRCIVAAKEKWSGFYHDFDEILNAIVRNKWLHNLG